MKLNKSRPGNFLSELLNYEKGSLGHITRMVDSGILTLSLKDYNELTRFQVIAFDVIGQEIMKWRSKKKGILII
jgi:hypothetical protein